MATVALKNYLLIDRGKVSVLILTLFRGSEMQVQVLTLIFVSVALLNGGCLIRDDSKSSKVLHDVSGRHDDKIYWWNKCNNLIPLADITVASEIDPPQWKPLPVANPAQTTYARNLAHVSRYYQYRGTYEHCVDVVLGIYARYQRRGMYGEGKAISKDFRGWEFGYGYFSYAVNFMNVVDIKCYGTADAFALSFPHAHEDKRITLNCGDKHKHYVLVGVDRRYVEARNRGLSVTTITIPRKVETSLRNKFSPFRKLAEVLNGHVDATYKAYDIDSTGIVTEITD